VTAHAKVARGLLLLATGALAAGIGGLAGAASQKPQTTATAIAVRIAVPGSPDVNGGEVTGPPGASTDVAGFAYPDDGSIVKIGSAAGTVAAQPGASSSAQATATSLAVSLFGGEITADTVSVRATAAAGDVTASADTSVSHIENLVVLGQSVTVADNAESPLADWGTLDLLVGTSSTATAAKAPKTGAAEIIGLRVKLSADHGGLAAGSEIDVGLAKVNAVASAAATAATTASATTPTTTTAAARPLEHGGKHVPSEPGTSIPGVPPTLVRPVPANVKAALTSGGYVFPVYGPATFGDTFGAPRGDVHGGWHHGEDIFAPMGTPLLAVADGTIHTVGWNTIGGWRLWLRDGQGNEFYYAHLSAYSPLATEGRHVHAGDVVGFLGKTGDAEFSLPHLHFEIHPVSLLSLGYDGVVAPYPFLIAWRRLQDVPFADGRTFVTDANGLPRAVAPAPGAFLMQATDVSSSSGLVPGALERTLAGSPTR
jgi:murein DD-endopeptidase MepM/ murein hydrolase activator NlpD